MSDQKTPHVFAAISAVTADLAKIGIAKARKNTQQGYKFRGIDDVYNALAPLLSQHKLLILPQALERTTSTAQTKGGGTLYFVVLKVQFAFISAVDGSSFAVVQYAEGMDSADKATNKASSAAYKYAVIQAFAIPVEGTPDADAETPTDDDGERPAPAQHDPDDFEEVSAPGTTTVRDAAKLRAQMAAVGISEKKILKYFEIKSLEQVSEEQLAALNGFIENKKAKLNADGGQG